MKALLALLTLSFLSPAAHSVFWRCDQTRDGQVVKASRVFVEKEKGFLNIIEGTVLDSVVSDQFVRAPGSPTVVFSRAMECFEVNDNSGPVLRFRYECASGTGFPGAVEMTADLVFNPVMGIGSYMGVVHEKETTHFERHFNNCMPMF